MVKYLSIIQEIWVWSLGWDNPLKKGMATHSSILAWRIPWTEKPDGLQSMGLKRTGHNWVTNCFTFTFFKENKTFESVLFWSQTISSVCVRVCVWRGGSSKNLIWIVGWKWLMIYFWNCLSNLMTMPKAYFRKFNIFFWLIFYYIINNYKWILNEKWCISFC